MARRRKTSPAEDIIELVALMPWWAGVLLAIVSYLLLHSVATRPASVNAQAVASSGFIFGAWLRGLATAGQYIAPVLFLAGAGASAWRRKQRTQLVADVAQARATDALDGMSWREFEMLVGEGFRLQGYQVVETGGGGPDGGVDLVLSKPGRNGSEKFLVQCKQWRAYKVGVDVVRELYGVMAARGATGGFVVTSGRFTDEAFSFASGRNVTLVDGPKLRRLLQEARASASSSTAERPAAQPPAQSRAEPVLSPACPLCSKPMVRRIAKRGANAGTEFWGCTGYPACRGTRAIG
jgi:restriction system protein